MSGKNANGHHPVMKEDGLAKAKFSDANDR
jgi:hypothetical protein